MKRSLRVFAILSFLFVSSNCLGDTSLKKMGQMPLLKAISDDGRTITNADFLNKFIVVNFFFTSCQGPCPILMEQVRKISDEFSNSDLLFLSITVDPETDSLEKLSEYRKGHSLNDPRIWLLRMPKEQVTSLINDGFKLGSGNEVVNHSTRFVLIDKSGTIRSLFNGDLAGMRNILSDLLQGD